ncbi:MAG: dephospho-CoA kinase [Oscillospiraceae bacterium]|nr:dephospho-CoA kinase [Oscillospiraceae bacterium]
MLVIGITGLTGSGKTTFLRAVEAKGGAVLDCDRLYADMVREDAPMRKALTDAFGTVFFPTGELDRKTLAQKVFSNPTELDKLNQIVYLHLGERVRQMLSQSTAWLFAIDAVNLIQSGLANLCTVTVGVTAPAQVRLARIVARDGISETDAQKRMDAQPNDVFFHENCTYILQNDASSQAEFEAKAQTLLDTIIKENGT